MAIPNPFSSSVPGAAAKKRAEVKTAKKGAEAQTEALSKSVGLQRQALAPALTNIGNVYNQDQLVRGDYLGALGVGSPAQQAAAKAAYGNYLQPIDQYGIEDLFRYGGQSGTTASGGTQKDLYDYGYTTRFQPWLTALGNFESPLAANAQFGTLASKLADIEGTYGTNVASVLANKFGQLGQARAGYFDTVAGARQNAAGNVLNAGIAGVNALGNVAGMAMNPGATKLPQYAAATPAPGGTFPGGWGMG